MAAEEDIDASLGARTFWTGAISFGLVSVPVSLFPATRARSVSLKMVTPDGASIQRRYVCSKDGDVLDADDIVRGYEIEKGTFVVVTDDELEAIAPRKSREIELKTFVDIDEIDPIYFERAYYLAPSTGSSKAYRLLAEVMEKKRRAGIATFVMRAKEYLVAIIAENGILRAETLRFDDEIRKPADVGLPKKTKAKPAEVKKFESEIGRRSGKVDFSEFLDAYSERLEKLVEKKKRQHADIIEAPEEDEDEGGQVIDLLAVLNQSLRGADARPRSRARRAPARSK